MLVPTKEKNNDYVGYQNAGPKINFLSVFTHARGRCFVTSEYVTD